MNGDPLLGTLAISHDTLHHLCKDLCRELWAAGFRKIIIVQSHGQEWNFQTIAHKVATELRREGKALFIAAATYWELAAETIRQEISSPFWHACEWETSAMLCAKPELVKRDAIQGRVRVPLIDKRLIKGSVTRDATETFAVQDVASWVNIPEPGEIHDWGVDRTDQIQSATAHKGEKVLRRVLGGARFGRALDQVRQGGRYGARDAGCPSNGYGDSHTADAEPRNRSRIVATFCRERRHSRNHHRGDDESGSRTACTALSQFSVRITSRRSRSRPRPDSLTHLMKG